MKELTRILLIASGTLCVALAIVGIFLPVWPTTPFLLLAAFCYSRSSSRFYHLLLSNRWFGTYIRNYREGRGIPLGQKLLAIFLLWVAIGYAAVFVVSPWWAKTILVAIAAGVTVHLIRVKTLKPEQEDH